MRQHINVSASSSDSDITLLSFGQHITALAAGKLDQGLETAADTLFIGSQTNLLAYDVEKNSELFYKDVCTEPQGEMEMGWFVLPWRH